MRANFCIAVFAVCITRTFCFCFRGEMEVETTGNETELGKLSNSEVSRKLSRFSGQIRKYCEYEGIKMMKGAKFDTLDCLSCECSNSGLQCCGTGYKAGVMVPPSGCEIIQDGCKPLLVMASDHTKRCGTGKPVLRRP